MDKMDGLSMDLEKEARERLRSVFPDCFAEGKLDIDKLLTLCGEYITNDFEKYKFEWKGKSECLQLAQRRSTGTLRPCKEESVNFDETQNLYVEGDNLEVLKILQTAYFRRVKMIYIDPPYNTGNDFVYKDDFTDPMARYKEVTQQTTKSNPETMGRFHTNWLNMMYPRLRLTANLLRDDGFIFISIDDGEQSNIRKLCDEVFGEENFICQFIWHCRQNVDSRSLNGASIDHEYVICYSKSYETRITGKEINKDKYKNPDNDPRGPWMSSAMDGLATVDLRPNLHYPIINPETGKIYNPNPSNGWRFQRSTVETMILENRIIWPKNDDSKPRFKRYLNELGSHFTGFSSMLDVDYTLTGTKELREIMGMETLKFPKPISLIKNLIVQGMSPTNNDIILDFFSGSATTAHAVMQLNAEDGGNRQFIMVQLPELCDEKSEAYKAGYKNICEIGKERIRRAGTKILKDAQEKNTQFMPDVGFKVFKLDSSNLKTWDASSLSEEELTTLFDRMSGMFESIKPDRSPLDVVYEIMLKMGVELTYSVTPVEISGKTAYSVGDERLLLICLEGGISSELIEKMADYAPAKIILGESSLTDDSAMRNAYYILRDRQIELKLV